MQFYSYDSTLLKCDVKEVLRYMGIPNNAIAESNIERLAMSALDDVKKAARPKAVWCRYNVKVIKEENTIAFSNKRLHSSDLTRFFTCHGEKKSAVLIASTIGSEVDSILRKALATDSARALAVQGAGAALVEAFVDKVCISICKALGERETTMRYSPGYGDVSLDVQDVFFNLLDTDKAGITLMDTKVIAPEKSVTAFMAF